MTRPGPSTGGGGGVLRLAVGRTELKARRPLIGQLLIACAETEARQRRLVRGRGRPARLPDSVA